MFQSLTDFLCSLTPFAEKYQASLVEEWEAELKQRPYYRPVCGPRVKPEMRLPLHATHHAVEGCHGCLLNRGCM